MSQIYREQTSEPSDELPSVAAKSAEERRLYLRVALRIVPLLFVCYVVAFLDRINVGFAKLQMQDALRFSDAVYGLGAGIFFLSYCLLEVPSALLLKRMGAKKTIARIMICWGIVGTSTAFISNVPEFYAVRLLLGVFEAGFFCGGSGFSGHRVGVKRVIQTGVVDVEESRYEADCARGAGRSA